MKLKDLIPLKSKITVYVPATVDVNVAENGALVAEKTTMVFAFCDTAAAEKYIDDVVTLCNELKHEMGQEAVALEYNGSMYFI